MLLLILNLKHYSFNKFINKCLKLNRTSSRTKENKKESMIQKEDTDWSGVRTLETARTRVSHFTGF